MDRDDPGAKDRRSWFRAEALTAIGSVISAVAGLAVALVTNALAGKALTGVGGLAVLAPILLVGLVAVGFHLLRKRAGVSRGERTVRALQEFGRAQVREMVSKANASKGSNE